MVYINKKDIDIILGKINSILNINKNISSFIQKNEYKLFFEIIYECKLNNTEIIMELYFKYLTNVCFFILDTGINFEINKLYKDNFVMLYLLDKDSNKKFIFIFNGLKKELQMEMIKHFENEIAILDDIYFVLFKTPYEYNIKKINNIHNEFKNIKIKSRKKCPYEKLCNKAEICKLTKEKIKKKIDNNKNTKKTIKKESISNIDFDNIKIL